MRPGPHVCVSAFRGVWARNGPRLTGSSVLPGVATIHIETSGRDYSFNHEQYDALVAELESQGASVSIEQLPEERGGLQNANEIVVRVGGLATTGLSLEALVAALEAHLRRRQVGPRIATIYGPDGREVLSTVELEED
jgi:hypothetical protein